MEPVYEFRPLPDYFGSHFMRYANGLWIPDDGEYDLAFIGNASEGYPLCLYVQVPCRENIVCSWRSGHYCSDMMHPHENAWHYALKAGTSVWGNPKDRWDNPNRLASDSGMHTKSSMDDCCNGRSILFEFYDKHIAAGLVRDRDTKQVFEWSNISCHYCGERPTQSENNKALKDAVALHVALKRLKENHPSFNKCNCMEVVIAQNAVECGA